MVRSRTNYWVAGVFGGLGKAWGISPLVLRILFILFGVWHIGWLFYIVAALTIPAES